MKKTDYNKGHFTILTTDTDGFEYEDYLDYCEDNDITPGEEDSDEFYEWCREEADCNFEADMENIKYCKAYNIPVLVTGSLGLWWGRPEIKARMFPSVYEAIMEMRDSGSIMDIEAAFDDGKIEVNAYHHDGCNTFTIQALSAKGQNRVDYDGYIDDPKPTDTKRLPYLYAIGV